MTVLTFQLCAYLSGFTEVERIKLNSFPRQAGNSAAGVNRGGHTVDSSVQPVVGTY